MDIILVLTILPLAALVHGFDLAKTYKCDRVLLEAAVKALDECNIDPQTIMDFLSGKALLEQPAQVSLAAENNTNIRKKRDFIPDGWQGDEKKSGGGGTMSEEQAMAVLEDMIGCFEEELDGNAFYIDIRDECNKIIENDNSQSRLVCFFKEGCKRCPELVAILMGNMDVFKTH